MSNPGDHHWGQQHATAALPMPPTGPPQPPQVLPPQQSQQQPLSASQLPPTLPPIQQADLGPQAGQMSAPHYPYGGPALSSSQVPPMPYNHGAPPLPAVESLSQAHHVRPSHHSTPQDVVVTQSAGPPPAPAPPMQMTSVSGHTLPADLTSAESHVLGASQSYRPLNVKDALSYLDQVKIRFSDQPEVYNRFLDIMKDFKSQSLDTPGVIDRVSTLFREHPELISGFNTFLPPGYKIEPGPNGDVKVTTPRDAPPYHSSSAGGLQSLGDSATSVSNGTASTSNTSQLPSYFGSSTGSYGSSAMANLPISQLAQHAASPSVAAQGYNAAIASASNIISSMQSHGASALQQSSSKGGEQGANRRAPVEFNHAINYVNKIKNRFSTEPETYKQFLEILQTYQKEQKPIQEVYAQVQVLFKGAPDLLDEFKQFLPDNSNNQGQNGLAAFGRSGGMPVLSTMPNGMAVTQVQSSSSQRLQSQPAAAGAKQKQHKRPAPSTTPTGGGSLSSNAATIPSGQIPVPPPKKKAKMARSEKPGTLEELEFFDKCKKVINNKTTYNEFLKILNLFSQEIIEAKVLVERVEPFLSKAPDLFEWFKRFVKYEDDEVIYNIPAERPEINVNSLRRLGHSYRQLPSEIPRPKCSGRDALCKEVLNDEWISHPVYVSETGFVSHKKTQFEEALHKCEEERYEFDMNIESNLHTIALLEPIAKKIQNMSAEERNRLRYPEGLGGTSKTIYQRVIKKIYDKERGAEIIEALHNNPAVAVPVVLKRLKQKDEEWKRAQREWNKVWREIDSKNYYKALDHQGIHFKAADKKNMSHKSLISEVEMLAREQREKRSTLPSRYQFDFTFKDRKIFHDIRRLLRLQTEVGLSLNDSEARKMKNFLRVFVDRFFDVGHSPVEQEVDSEDEEEDVDMDTEDDSPLGSNSRSKQRSSSLRRNVLTRKSNGRDTGEDTDEDGDIESVGSEGGRGQEDTPGASGDEGADMMDMDGVNVAKDRDDGFSEAKRATYVFYSNNAFYVFVRLYQTLYSRLVRMKELSQELSQNPPKADRKSPVATELGLQKEAIAAYANLDRYTELLQSCFHFLQSDLEASEFEDKARNMFGTSAYLIFTVDKLCQAITKQMLAIVSDQKNMELVSLYYKDRSKVGTSARQEAMYRINSESLIQDDNIYRMEYFIGEKVLTIQLLGKDDHISDDSISHEDKWSLYVDHFVQLHSTEGLRSNRREPFLKRNLPTQVPDTPPTNIETRSGLEMKICVNTYKVFFVDHTEDYFSRRRSGGAEISRTEADGQRKRFQKFRSWLDGPLGWKRGLNAEDIKGAEKDFTDWLTGSGEKMLTSQKVAGDNHDFSLWDGVPRSETGMMEGIMKEGEIV
ncbi:uncharacterized protein SPPG_00072 [Spizellomyces punctatus DAOM BR117]|uniref:Histone deacetylase interacting domain-containing protein n=1 Tax=Spizellomyces punctatus (strain DAOM BR117) TaxID=645134 RepID=A0A0L0HSK1_SPIPD|nr:uncharacterized protein SPPG_00072 [Spizellomyces punctatus DAOM BR117]KND04341.1 hypothetical protein SPPG_00072 [Spizellomyces punctatus DAOM BR117]|eukprot:XP_016612380.1 hypothetical protein SPPG_00072 [Spizellomyces punctatus DAOM BR117]